MTALLLRRVNPAVAQCSRLLGGGLTLGFTAQGMAGELSLHQIAPSVLPGTDGEFLHSAIGLLRLTDAGAVLSLLGNAPVVLQGSHQPWYWQYVNQQLSTPIAALLAPIAPSQENAPGFDPMVCCRLRVRLGDESVHAVLSTTPDTLLLLLNAAHWQPLGQPLSDDMEVPQPVVIGQLALTLDQLASLRPGDVVLPTQCGFDCDGNGQLEIGGRHWRVGAEAHAKRLVLRLGHEENFQDGQ